MTPPPRSLRPRRFRRTSAALSLLCALGTSASARPWGGSPPAGFVARLPERPPFLFRSSPARHATVAPSAVTNVTGRDYAVSAADAVGPASNSTSSSSASEQVREGRPHTAASRAKISAANKGRTPWNAGRSHSPETKAKIRAGVLAAQRRKQEEAAAAAGMTEEEWREEKERKASGGRRSASAKTGRGHTLTPETRAKISSSLKKKWAEDAAFRGGRVCSKRKEGGDHVRRGHPQSEETRKKISESLKRRWEEDEEFREGMLARNNSTAADASVRARISATLKARWTDPDFRADMMRKMAGRKTPQKSEEHRRRISEAIRRKWEDGEYRDKAVGGMRRSMQERGMGRTGGGTQARKVRKKPNGPPKPRAPRAPAVRYSRTVPPAEAPSPSSSPSPSKKETAARKKNAADFAAAEGVQAEQAAAERAAAAEADGTGGVVATGRMTAPGKEGRTAAAPVVAAAPSTPKPKAKEPTDRIIDLLYGEDDDDDFDDEDFDPYGLDQQERMREAVDWGN